MEDGREGGREGGKEPEDRMEKEKQVGIEDNVMRRTG